MGSLPERIETERLVVRRWQPGEASLLGQAINDSLEHLRPWMAWIALEPLTDDERAAKIRGWHDAWLVGNAVFGVFAKADADGRSGEVVGGAGLHRRRGPSTLEIGYWVAAAHTNRGYATEVTAALTTAAFEQPGIDRVEIHHDKANTLSGRVPARLGYAKVGESPDAIDAPGECGIDVAWSIDKATWDELFVVATSPDSPARIGSSLPTGRGFGQTTGRARPGLPGEPQSTTSRCTSE